ncbi:hypothetical protein AVEN_86857-1 [Araneus ventricosus]|uniref:Uncharacterized protein n=1 Tax=Araneus ventricosus TaxID=182803 RepID=A0A4Y2NEV6_ARAVE|nr:hypothetical protein AVEN_86857-1 [Araneus ventricosus]
MISIYPGTFQGIKTQHTVSRDTGRGRRKKKNPLLNPTANPSSFGLGMMDGICDRRNIGKSHVQLVYPHGEWGSDFLFLPPSSEGRIYFLRRAYTGIYVLMLFPCNIS